MKKPHLYLLIARDKRTGFYSVISGHTTYGAAFNRRNEHEDVEPERVSPITYAVYEWQE